MSVPSDQTLALSLNSWQILVISMKMRRLGTSLAGQDSLTFEVGWTPHSLSYTHLPPPDWKSDAWIRLHVFPGDLIILLAGIYHCFTLDESNRIKALCLFQVRMMELWQSRSTNGQWQDEPKWVLYTWSKDTDANPYRIKYIQGVHEANWCAASLWLDTDNHLAILWRTVVH